MKKIKGPLFQLLHLQVEWYESNLLPSKKVSKLLPYFKINSQKLNNTEKRLKSLIYLTNLTRKHVCVRFYFLL